MAAAAEQQQPLVKVAEIPGRGRSLVAIRDIKAGEVILSDSPILLYPNSYYHSPSSAAVDNSNPQPSSSSFCSQCFRTLTLTLTADNNILLLRCSSCPSLFCSPRCLSLHPKPLCQALTNTNFNTSSSSSSRDMMGDPDSRTQTNFLVSAYSLSLTSPTEFQRLLSLQPSPSSQISQSSSSSSSIINNPYFPPDLTEALLARDLANAFGLMEPNHGNRNGKGNERRVRAYGIYPLASFFNHDCLPNACRFDYIDSPPDTPLRNGNNNTDIIIRAIHDIPQGREVCLSYFPVNWPYKERQRRLAEDYGFLCKCDRCRVESNWDDDDDNHLNDKDDNQDDDDDEGMEEEDNDDRRGMEEDHNDDRDDGDFPHAYFFVRYLCDSENCGGTLAPLPPSPEGVPSDVLECNVCGKLRNQDDFDGDGLMMDDQE